MKRHSVYFEENNEEVLVYESGGNLLEYEKTMHSYVIPSTSEFLLQHLASVHSFLDAVYAAFYAKEQAMIREEGEDRFALLFQEYDEREEEAIALRDSTLELLRLDLVCLTLFRWHGDVMTREGEEMTGAYAVCYFSSWGAYTRAFHLYICSHPEKVPLYTENKASDYAYCQMASRRANLYVSEEPLIKYSMDDLWNSMFVITPTLYTYSYSPAMRNYVSALFFRYADLLASQQHEEDVDAVFDNPLFFALNEISEEEGEEEDDDEDDEYVDTFDAFKKLSIQANETYSINNTFLYEGEALFYHQLYRMRLSDDLIRFHGRPGIPIEIHYTHNMKRFAFLKVATEQWFAMAVTLSKDTYIKQTLVERYTAVRTEMHLYHGDRERYKRKFPTSAADARDILLETRPIEMSAINNSQSLVLADLLNAFKNAYCVAVEALQSKEERRVLESSDEEWAVLNYEQEALLLTKMATTLYFTQHKVSQVKGMDAAFILEELCTLQSVDERIFTKRRVGEGKKAGWPTFLKLMRIYYVLDNQSNKIFKTLYFVEAFFVWLCLCRRSGIVEEQAIHPKLLSVVKKLNDIMQC